jgi:hypothetical protein
MSKTRRRPRMPVTIRESVAARLMTHFVLLESKFYDVV